MKVNTNVQKYVELKNKIAQLSEELKEIENKVFETVSDSEFPVSFNGFTLKVVYRPRWKYSSALEEMEKSFKETTSTHKKEEENNGKAEKLSDGGYLMMTKDKEEEK
jgi:MinD-like ATPase involved in chromosome partitioning or flagellar assembly